MYTFLHYSPRKYSDIDKILNSRVAEACILSENYNSTEYHELGEMAAYLRKAHREAGYTGKVKAQVFIVSFAPCGIHHPTVADIAGIAKVIRDCYCDYEMCMGIVACGQGCFQMYFVINPVHLDIGTELRVEARDILNMCSISRLDHTYGGYLTPQYKMDGILCENEDFFEYDEEDEEED